MIKAILYFLVLIVFVSCEVCGISSEPELLVAFNNSQRFQKVKVLGANKQIESFNGTLPINLNSNFTTYVFESATKTDTLTVFYKIKIINKNSSCGYILDIADPVEKQYNSTFKNVSVMYVPYYQENKGLKSRSNGGIYVNITQ